jgi:hypothetical protein
LPPVVLAQHIYENGIRLPAPRGRPGNVRILVRITEIGECRLRALRQVLDNSVDPAADRFLPGVQVQTKRENMVQHGS